MLVRIVVDYADTQFSNFAIKNLRENEIVHETVCACSMCSYGALVESFRQIKMVESLVALSLTVRSPVPGANHGQCFSQQVGLRVGRSRCEYSKI